MWKVLNKEVDLGEPTSFLDHVYLGCTQRQCEICKDVVDNYFGEVGLIIRLHLFFVEVRSVTTALKVVEEVQQGLQEIEGE